jgi:hypothetical protein
MSALHSNPKFIKRFELYTICRTYGGLLQLDKPGYDLVSSFKNSPFKNKLYSRDSSFDYYYITVIDDYHFGNATEFFTPGMKKMLAISCIYPLAFYQYFYYTLGLWMWMWDGKIHYGANKNYTFEEDKNKRPVTLYWHVYQK